MSILFFKKEFLPLILSGKKTQTIRGKTPLKKGGKFLINFKIPAEVIQVTSKYFSEITEEEAQRDGFFSLKHLKDWMILNNQMTSEKLNLIQFRLLDDA